jgi:hypothetical protein
VNLGICGLPLATPEPLQGMLLPCAESVWNRGESGSNEPLFTSSFSTNSDIGPFVNTCQACHILGLVLRHRDEYRSSTIDPYFRISEAHQLHQTLVALNTHLAENPRESGDDNSTDVASSTLLFARIILYNLYECNGPRSKA